PVLLCGGYGTRLWPLSRTALPKQFLPLLSQHSLLQDTLKRLIGIKGQAAPIVLCNNDHRFLLADQLLEIETVPAALIIEPVARNTAPAVALAAFQALQRDPNAQLLVLSSDHAIRDVAAFHRAITIARESAQNGFLTTLGVVPDKPETGYGYIECGDKLPSGASAVKRFVEKPDAARAAEFIADPNFLWNSGTFLFGAAQFLEELQQYAPDVYNATKTALENAHTDLDFIRVEEESFSNAPAISVDYAVMEKTACAAVVPVEMGWSDVGSYAALWEVEEKDADGNAARGETAIFEAKNCYVHAEKQLVALLGVEDLVVVATPDAILVTKKERSQDVKHIVDELKKQGRTEHEVHTKVFRPWGWYEGVDRGERFQVKQLVVKPGQKSSMQIHHHRSEHWVVVKGTAEVTLSGEKRLLSEDESIYIPLGAPHRIYNPGRIPLHFIEVQSGSYLEENDIVRIDDEYGRG
ncbi:MAG: mannose-1-phosphate guanylyltransferase/mannose-6-phosphate isomerase, partial [Armatimonadetes bacterium]|nr:mannose-1-phosphate guanylyltransferase/mannose-6-phosphate isomerase [Armatimonadota bacterium]